MSGAIRSHPRRSAARSAASLPYARPKQAAEKKSAWAIATGLLSFLNPLRLRSASPSLIDVDEDEDDEEPSVDVASEDESPPVSLSARGRQMAHNLTAPSMQSPPPVPCLLPDSSSPEKNLRTVANFLEQRRGQAISPLEAEGLISLIHKSTPPEKPEPFRFSSSVPSTPARGNSPANDLFTLGASSPAPAPGTSPRKTLAKNPNGSYRWSGAGSARPSKNRYASPAFGTSSRASSPRLVFQDSPSKTSEDASPKRRRLETPAATPPPVPRSAAPAPSPNRVAASQHFPFPHSSTPASSPVAGSSLTPLTPNTLLKKTMPAHPSPLRQAWGGSPRVLNIFGKLVACAGHANKGRKLAHRVDSADVRNPYQSASPVGIRVTNTHPPEAATRKRTRATGRSAAAREAEKKEKEAKEKVEQEKKEKEKEKEVVPPQAIIEATLPKGSKRSRPPANFNPSASLNSLAPPSQLSPRRSPRLEPQRIEVEDDAEEKEKEERDAGAPVAKRARMPNGAPVNGNSVTKDAPPANGINDKKDAPLAPAAAAQPFTFPASTSAPSIFTNGSSGSSSGPTFTMGGSASTNNVTPTGGFEFRMGPKPLATAPKEPSKLRYSFQPPPTPPPAADKDKPAAAEKKTLFPMDPPPPPAPKSLFQPFSAPSAVASTSASASTSAKDPKDAARALASSALPSYVFAVLTNAPSSSDAHVKARDAARRLDKSALPVFDFTAPASASAKDKGKEKEKAPVQGFNWAAAGAAPPKPATSTPGSWTCGTCMLSNGPEATEKCSVCEAVRPDVPAKAAPVVKGFDWSAAGAAPPKPATNTLGSWTCGTCMLSNGPEATEKCSVCEAVRPDAPAKAAPVVKGFDWAGGGGEAAKACERSRGVDLRDVHAAEWAGGEG
ncbi:E3 sumo-protein ligase 2-like protein [Mycena venus]|uniref:E3 sumo-protein ligase 2-like protein n=1 Tax=Mycena venus TaxID=2733690 RepID=A0A8H6YDV0_9AGAR|nr:E3 sumo-protein ligase 2-like protein [Mycena venus]